MEQNKVIFLQELTLLAPKNVSIDIRSKNINL